MRYQHHLFLCVNERDDGECCGKRGALDLLKTIKQELRERGLDHEGGIMANKSGCFGRCSQGPNLVVYPQGTWHQIRTKDQALQLIDQLQLQSE